MNKAVAKKKEVPALTRDQLRAALISNTPEAESIAVTLFGVEIDLRQPSLASIMKAREQGDAATRAVDMIIEYAYVPGTDEHIFEDTDRDRILKWPFGKDLTVLNKAVADLTGVDLDAAEAALQDPLAG